jgi:hypothetical protein
MGLLDDAIREHLELKRRHGADPQEVARQEDEALGPIGGHAPDESDEDDLPEVSDDQLSLDEPPAPAEPPAAAEDRFHDFDRADEPPHVGEEPAEEPAVDVHQPTVEFSMDDEPPAHEPGEAEEPADELEETPEFLQETPEHDRLWFEQKPPRDFDF